MRLVSAHKGGRVYRCKVTGKAAHSSLTHTAVNAIDSAATGDRPSRRSATRERETGLRAAGFDVPFTTISTNLINGGNGPNIVPAQAEFLFDYRYIPGFDPATIIAELERFPPPRNSCRASAGHSARSRHRILPLVNMIPALNAQPGEPPCSRMALDLLARTRPSRKVAYGTEASLLPGLRRAQHRLRSRARSSRRTRPTSSSRLSSLPSATGSWTAWSPAWLSADCPAPARASSRQVDTGWREKMMLEQEIRGRTT